MTPNISLEIRTVNDSNLPDDLIWEGDGWTAGYSYGLNRKEPGEMENFKMKVRITDRVPLNLAPGQRVEAIYLGETILFNLVSIDRVSSNTLGGLTILKLDTLP